MTLFWGQKRNKEMIPLDKNLNIGLMWAAPGTEGFNTYLATVEQSETEGISTIISDIISDDYEDDETSLQPPDPVQAPKHTDKEDITALQTTNKTEGGTTTVGVQDHLEIHTILLPLALSQQGELMRWHH